MSTKQTKKDERRHPSLRGCRHLRVGIELRDSGASVKSIWVVDQPVVQLPQTGAPIYVRVDIAGRPVLLQGVLDPRVCRGVYRRKHGHSYWRAEAAMLFVSVPFDDERELIEMRIRVLDATRAGVAPVEHEPVSCLFDTPPQAATMIVDFGIDVLRRHLDFVEVAKCLGWIVNPGTFEICADPAGGFRWRLRRIDGAVMAESARAYPTRAACEEDVRWVKANAAASPIASHDLPGGSCKC
jgi:uncharacterized protein YegP (UPF0339 family)